MNDEGLEGKKEKALARGNVIVEVSGGVVIDVLNLPKGVSWTLIDWDE